VHPLDSAGREAVRRMDRPDVVLDDGVVHVIGAFRFFEAGDEFAAEEFELAAVGVVVGAVDDIHAPILPDTQAHQEYALQPLTPASTT